MNMQNKLLDAPWLHHKDLQTLLEVLSINGQEARIVGGAVRNHLLLKPISDIDIATTCLPDETTKRAEDAGFKAVPTGIDFGTITIVTSHTSYEVTTLRADIETDGRHAKVLFGNDWEADALRRDFTMNALYADRYGQIYDYVDGLKDIHTQTLRFIGEAEQRIREDYLRILRFFRFFSWYGVGRPDGEGLKACARLKQNIEQLSSERVWSEMKKLLSASDPSRALLWMRQTGVLNVVLPESEKWGIDAIHALIETGNVMGWQHDPILRLISIVPPDDVRLKAMAKRLKLSNLEKTRVMNWVKIGKISTNISELDLQKMIYKKGRQPVLDQLGLELAAARARGCNDDQALLEAGHYNKLYSIAENFEIPTLPIRGHDLIEKGFEKGPILGETLKKLENIWLESGFINDKATLLAVVEKQS